MNRLLAMMLLVTAAQHVHGEHKIQGCGLVQLMQRISDVCSAKNLYSGGYEGREVGSEFADRELVESQLRKCNIYLWLT